MMLAREDDGRHECVILITSLLIQYMWAKLDDLNVGRNAQLTHPMKASRLSRYVAVGPFVPLWSASRSGCIGSGGGEMPDIGATRICSVCGGPKLQSVCLGMPMTPRLDFGRPPTATRRVRDNAHWADKLSPPGGPLLSSACKIDAQRRGRLEKTGQVSCTGG